MALDFTSLAKDGEDFELLCRDVLESRGIDILSHPSRGPDGKKDILISISQKNLLDVSEKTIFLVQCKHY
ncbi:MAG: restriction endonuclease, partial [Thalassolituus sp.]